MARTDNQARAQQGLYAKHLGPNLVGRSVNQKVLSVDTAHKGYPAFKVPCQRPRVHIRRQCLQGMQAIHPCGNQPVDHLVNRPAGMEDGLIPMRVGLLRETLEPRQNELVKLGRATNQVELGAEIVPKKKPSTSSFAWAKKRSLAS